MLFFYRRIFVTRKFKICTWVLIGLSFIWLAYATVAWLLYCGTNVYNNFEGGWTACPLWGYELQMAVFAFDCFIDLFILILPIPFVSLPILRMS